MLENPGLLGNHCWWLGRRVCDFLVALHAYLHFVQDSMEKLLKIPRRKHNAEERDISTLIP
jgi:hypothetical protein